jgi:hypothetical protein
MLNIKPSHTAEGCKVARIAQHLDKADRDTYLSAIDDTETWSAYALEIALKQRGIFVSNDMIGLHRKGACRCRL